jgi:hypothetical protein
MKAVFWVFLFAAFAGLVILALQLRSRWAARKLEEEARAMQMIAEAMRAKARGTGDQDSTRAPDRKQP